MLSYETKLSKMHVWQQPASLVIEYSDHCICFILGLAPTLGQSLLYRRADRYPILDYIFLKRSKTELKKQNTVVTEATITDLPFWQ